MLSLEEVRHTALLARLALSPEEEESFQKELSSVLDFFGALATVDTKAVSPIGHITGRVGEARTDTGELGILDDERAQIRENFPEQEAGYLGVRSVL